MVVLVAMGREFMFAYLYRYDIPHKPMAVAIPPDDQTTILRLKLQEKTQNARLMAQLSYLLQEQAKTFADTEIPSVEREKLLRESLHWAKTAIDSKPDKPFGYAALSLQTCLSPSKRFQAIRDALERADIGAGSPQQHQLLRLQLQLRLLLEPRQEQAKESKTFGKASPKHPSRSDLTVHEWVLYHRLEKELVAAYESVQGSPTITHGESEEDYDLATPARSNNNISLSALAKCDTKLGLFFRKRVPVKEQRTRAIHHLSRAENAYQEYIATETTDENDDTEETTTRSKESIAESLAVVQFWLGTLTENNRVTQCPASYIQGLYSGAFVDTFDTLLVEKLDYKTPTLLRTLLDETIRHKQWNRGLDLGCGTGLSGVAFRDCITADWTGVDLSPGMVEQAEKRDNCYSEVRVGDVVDACSQFPGSSLGLVTACDVLVYFGDLKPLFMAVYDVLQALDGCFCFSTELMLQSDEAASDFVLHECARFAHSKTFVEAVAKECGFTILALETAPCLRKNQGSPVAGLLGVVVKEV